MEERCQRLPMMASGLEPMKMLNECTRQYEARIYEVAYSIRKDMARACQNSSHGSLALYFFSSFSVLSVYTSSPPPLSHIRLRLSMCLRASPLPRRSTYVLVRGRMSPHASLSGSPGSLSVFCVAVYPPTSLSPSVSVPRPISTPLLVSVPANVCVSAPSTRLPFLLPLRELEFRGTSEVHAAISAISSSSASALCRREDAHGSRKRSDDKILTKGGHVDSLGKSHTQPKASRRNSPPTHTHTPIPPPTQPPTHTYTSTHPPGLYTHFAHFRQKVASILECKP